MDLIGQRDAERLLGHALAAPRHAYLLQGPRGCGLAVAASAFAAALVETTIGRVERDAHPDVGLIEPEGEVISIDEIRALRTDLHLRPFEAARRVYVLREAERMTPDAANALLKSLEEPPPHAVLVLTCHDRARLLPTIESRCQVVRFRALAPAVIASALGGSPAADRAARLAGGDLARARELLDEDELRAHEAALDLAHACVLDAGFDSAAAVAAVLDTAKERGRSAERDVLEAANRRLPEGARATREGKQVLRDAEARAKRRRRRAETDELRRVIGAIASYWRDVLCVAAGAPDVVVHRDRIAELEAAAGALGVTGASRVLRSVAASRQTLELPVTPGLALEALLLRLAASHGMMRA